VDCPNLRRQRRVVLLTLRRLPFLPLVVGGAGDLGDPAQLRHRIPTTLRLDEPVPAHRVSIAKKAAARLRMSRSSRSTRFSRRNRRSSSRSSVVRPSRAPASMAACSTQRRTAVSLRSISRQLVGIVRSPRCTKAMTSGLNEAVNDRRGRRPARFSSTFFPIRTPSSWAYAHIWGVRRSGARPVFVEDGKNLVQLTNFRRVDTSNPFPSVTPGRAFFTASADPIGENPSGNCQLFSIGTRGDGLRQITHLDPGSPASNVVAACWMNGPPECPVGWQLNVQDPVTKTVLFYS